MFSSSVSVHTPVAGDDASVGGGAPAGAPGRTVLDPVALARLQELDPTGANQLLQRVLKAFQTSVARLRPQAEAARRSGDNAAIRLVAHTLKSSSASIGALGLSALCAHIEASVRAEPGADQTANLDTLAAALDDVMGAIELRLREGV